ncbi:hypothetical protein BGW38_010409 [Lunasporangiospora selenospora]|uniref:Uncharacterized protein n=1 Tax=Lunasporangiospora selenospora TaxID=979761 RepID=A0A9P6KIP3_9FUNG|nr:hypothetical protein BGW38_010409 [Lunasporangiospora selenospora]
MLRRDPSRLELKASDILDLDRAREEYLESVRIKTKEARLHRVTPAPPPPTPANRNELKAMAGVTGAGDHATSKGSGSSSSNGTGNSASGGGTNPPVAGSASTMMLDPIEIAHLERKAKSTRERIGLGR